MHLQAVSHNTTVGYPRLVIGLPSSNTVPGLAVASMAATNELPHARLHSLDDPVCVMLPRKSYCRYSVLKSVWFDDKLFNSTVI